MQKVTPFIWCVDNAKEMVEYYVSIFPGAKVTKENPMVTSFEIFGQHLSAMNGWPHETLNPSISFSLWVRDEALTKELWDKLSDGGSVLMEYNSYPWSKGYGRCNDRFGVSRQVMYDDCAEHATHQLIPSLLFTQDKNGKAEEAMKLYTSVFPASSIGNIHRYGPDEPDIEWNIAHAEFILVNQLFIAAESSLSHNFVFNDGISLSVSCKDQAEVDHYREKLILDGGTEVQCGWGKDKYGVTRQITPIQLPEALFQADQEKANYAMQAMLKMKKIVIADLYT